MSECVEQDAGRRRGLRSVAVAPVRAYQRWISPALPARCRYYPSCSAYAVGAIEVHGVAKGLLLAAWRLLRCNPLTRGGVDHVPAPGRWRYGLRADQPRWTQEQASAHPHLTTDYAGSAPASGSAAM